MTPVAVKRTHGLFVRVNPAEATLIRRAAAAEGLRPGEYLRALARRDAERLLGAAGFRAVFTAAVER